MKFKNNNKAVTEVIGTMILLLIAVSVVTLVFYSTVSSLTSDSDKIVDIVGRLNPEENEANFAILEHQGGERLGDETDITFTIAGSKKEFTIYSNGVYAPAMYKVGPTMLMIL